MNAAFTQDRNPSAGFCSGSATGSGAGSDSALIAVLAAVCRAGLTGAPGGRITLDLSADVLDRFAELAGRARLWSVCALGCELPQDFAATARGAKGRAMISNGRVLGLARMAFPILERAGIAALAFKGPFQHRQLHGDPFFFRSGDLDLLVARSQFTAALGVLEANGFLRRAETSPWWTRALGEVHLTHPEGGVIDLHHRLQQPGCPPPRDLDAFLAGSAREQLGEVAICVPTPAQSLLIATLNFVKEFTHRRLSARYAYDLADGLLRLPQEERNAFAALACAQGLAGTAALAVTLAEALFGLELPLPPPLRRRALPDWAEPEALRAMVFDPEGAGTRWPRRRTILWAMCSAPAGPARTPEYAREVARMFASEALRRASGRAGE